jgi:putative glutamine amidotransferase
MKKIIGITGPSKFTPELRRMVSEYFGAIPLDINQNGEDLNQILPLCSAVIFGGGSDIMPTTYGEEILSHHRLSKFDKARDERELYIFDWCNKKKRQMLGICRGHQLILMHLGAQLHMDISSSEICHNPLNQDIEMDGNPVHYVECAEPFKDIFFERELVNSFHHQAVCLNPLATDYEEVGISKLKQVPTKSWERIVELAKGANFVSCQWHPECDWETNRASGIVLEYFKDRLNAIK